ncbi:MAG: SDR family oxidoreductase [Thermoflavifilum sp.]|nr:SDR family oxidoreductase [Thermoflavifilum sp.]
MSAILISGGTRGIGRAIARQFARNHWDVAICGRNSRALAEVADQLRAIYPEGKFLAHAVDMRDPAAIRDFVKQVQQQYAAIDVLVNNAGIFEPGAVNQEPEGQLSRMLEVNLLSAYHLTRAILPNMMTRKQGHIVNLCSTASYKAYPNGGSYSISKFALLGFSRNLREELKPYRIKVTAILPGPTLTDSWAGYPAPAERFIPPDDIASLIWQLTQLAPQTVVEEVLLRPMDGDIESNT